MGASHPSERLDHGDALHELHGGAVHVVESLVVGDQLLSVARHLAAVEQLAQNEGDHRHEGEPPVHPEHVRQRGDRGDDRRHDVVEAVRHHVVHCRHVVGDGLLHLPAGPLGEPPQRHPAQPIHEPPPSVQLEVVVGEMGDADGGEQQGDARPEPPAGHRRDHPHPGAVGGTGAKEFTGDLGDGDERDQARGRRQRLACPRDQQSPPHRAQQPAQRAAGRPWGGLGYHVTHRRDAPAQGPDRRVSLILRRPQPLWPRSSP